jgi:hypothetical protein
MSFFIKSLFFTVSISLCSLTWAASASDIDKLTTYATVLGRASACGISDNNAASRVGRWLDRLFPPGSKDQLTYLPIFLSGMQYAAEQQNSGKSPDNCAAVVRAFESMPWP